MYIRNADGEYVPFSRIETVTEIADPKYTQETIHPNLFDCCGMSSSIRIKVKRGAIDHLLQRPTMAAYRYVRLQKRQKEKARRKALKENNDL